MLFGFFALPLYAVCVAHLNDFVEPGGYVEAASGLLLVYAVGAVVGPMLAAASMERFGEEALFVFTASVHVLLVIMAFYRMCCSSAPRKDDKLTFANSLISAVTVANLDPRSEADPEDISRP